MSRSFLSFLKISFPSFVLLLCVVWFLYPEFTACTKDSIWCLMMYYTTQSAGRNGTLIIVLLASAGFTFSEPHPKQKAKAFFKTFFILMVFLAAFASLNENVIKPAVGSSRPSHLYIIKNTSPQMKLDSIYSLVVTQRRLFFRDMIKSDTIHFKTIDPRILEHWIEEAGYSFPSGHTFNAFLLGCILAFGIFHFSGERVTFWCFIPLVWACMVGVSRVAMGAHTALDVTGGAGLGLFISHFLITIPFTRKLLFAESRST